RYIGSIISSLFPALESMGEAKEMPHFVGQGMRSTYKTGLSHGHGFIGRTKVSTGCIGVANDIDIEHTSGVVIAHHFIAIGLIVVVVIIVVDVSNGVFHVKLNAVFPEVRIELAQSTKHFDVGKSAVSIGLGYGKNLNRIVVQRI